MNTPQAAPHSTSLLSAKLKTYFEDYSYYHKSKGNRVTHYFGIPMIVISLLGLLSHLTFGLNESLALTYFRIDAGTLLLVLAFFQYLYIDWKISIPFIFFLIGLYYLGRAIPIPLNWFFFVSGWVVQGIGHYVYEKRSPAFYKNLIHLFIGPLWIFSKFIGYR